jgi:hypothetical protein
MRLGFLSHRARLSVPRLPLSRPLSRPMASANAPGSTASLAQTYDSSAVTLSETQANDIASDSLVRPPLSRVS